MTSRAAKPDTRSNANRAVAGLARRRGDSGTRRATTLVRAFQHARASEQLVVLEGFHPLKHALRFGAEVESIVTYDRAALRSLADDHAPELAEDVCGRSEEIDRREFKRLGPYEPHTGVVSIARRVAYDPQELLIAAGEAPVVLLDDPRHRGNFGAVIRVAAAAQAAGVLSIGTQDPWHPAVVRGAAGLHFAVPVARLCPAPSAQGCEPGSTHRAAAAGGRGAGQLSTALALRSDRPLLTFDPAGDAFDPRRAPAGAILAFGSERRGISPELAARADQSLRLPMCQGVSSLNLASAVAAVLYGLRLVARPSGSAVSGVRSRPCAE